MYLLIDFASWMRRLIASRLCKTLESRHHDGQLMTVDFVPEIKLQSDNDAAASCNFNRLIRVCSQPGSDGDKCFILFLNPPSDLKAGYKTELSHI